MKEEHMKRESNFAAAKEFRKSKEVNSTRFEKELEEMVNASAKSYKSYKSGKSS